MTLRIVKTLYKLGFFLIIFLVSCSPPKTKVIEDKHYLVEWNELVIETMKTDGINPVLATRIFLYPNIAAYEVIAHSNKDYTSFENKLIELKDLPKISENINPQWASLNAYYKTMLVLNYREDLLDELYLKQSEVYKAALSKKIYNESISYGELVSQKILAWANEDRYKETKALPYYLSSELPGSWIPTPPEYRVALEPHWGTLRPLTIENLEDFSRPFLIPYQEDSNSDFYLLAKEVYDSSFVLTEEQKISALFWDDNPDLNNFQGHIPLPRRHVNPTAHWFSIINQICLKEKFSFEKSAQLFSVASIAFYDANLVCWRNKYESNLIRPVSYIQNLIDPDWMPMLVTPPFPEHTSGHSACSAACATVLTHFLGDNYAFTDSTHFGVGLGVGEFSSLMDAAWAVSYSRFYGGIHYKTGCVEGTEQGIMVGNHILDKLAE